MSEKWSHNNWLDKDISYFSSNFDKYKATFEIVFAIALSVFGITFPIALSQGENPMTWLVAVSAISFWVTVLTGWYLIRSSLKQRDITNILLEAIAKKLGVDVDKLKEQGGDNERNKPDNKL